MKFFNRAIMVMALGLAAIGHAQAQVAANLTASTAATNNNSSGSTAANEGVNNTNNFNSTTPDHTAVDNNVHYSGVTGSNTGVGLGSFSSSFSSDYCGGTAQGGISVPYVTTAFGKPVLGDPGVACVDTRAAVHSMEFSATYGNAAAKAVAMAEDAKKRGAADEEKAYRAAVLTYSSMSEKLAGASVNMLCNLSDDVRQAYRDAGIMCPETKQEKAVKAQLIQEDSKQQAMAHNQPTDPLVRSRMGLAPL